MGRPKGHRATRGMNSISLNFSVNINRVDVILTIFAAAAAIFFITGFRADPELATMGSVFLGYLVTGWVIILVDELLVEPRTKGKELGVEIADESAEHWLNIVTFGLLGFVGIVMMQIFTATLQLSAANYELALLDRLFGFMAGQSEEVFFRGAFLRVFLRILGVIEIRTYLEIALVIIAVILDSAMFSLLHVFVYGQMPSAMLAVFLSSLPICAVYLLSRSLTACSISHILLNSGLRVVM